MPFVNYFWEMFGGSLRDCCTDIALILREYCIDTALILRGYRTNCYVRGECDGCADGNRSSRAVVTEKASTFRFGLFSVLAAVKRGKGE